MREIGLSLYLRDDGIDLANFSLCRRKALREVQTLLCLGCHENIVFYFSSWFENDFLYIQMELCKMNL
ncbi:hypothetical protein SELMODRAFT_122114 [Selaginella moellendorffii]|uniref:Protein kinase domain-containing protein n=1 Tax=Selaginella moellendorffii TaxID=88036 RepID=D8SQ17_SELML|nr:hypothetical protein SELMODRAFT_122114 [Selaginella moellendorffii]